MTTMRALQKQNNEHISNRFKVIVINLPIIFGIVVLFFISSTEWILFWISQNKIPKGGFSGFLIGFLVETFLGHIIPFVVIALIIKGLIRKGTGNAEILLKLAFMLIPVSFVTVYWLFKYSDPFYRGFLVLINFFLILISLLVGIVVCKISNIKK